MAGTLKSQPDRPWLQRHLIGCGGGAWRNVGITGGSNPGLDGVVWGKSPLGVGHDATVPSDVIGVAGILIGLQFASHYEWRVSLRLIDGGHSVSMFVLPSSLRELFKLRDIPEGGKRRAALLHWVSGHMRRVGDGDDEAWVRRHLRGRTEFRWGQLSGLVVPSADALREIAKTAAP